MNQHRSDIEKRICVVAARVFELQEVSAPRGLKRGEIAAWDSMGHLALMLELEREFGIRFSTQQIESLQSISTIVDTVVKYQPE
jgi:acyl carrier protein